MNNIKLPFCILFYKRKITFKIFKINLFDIKINYSSDYTLKRI